MKLRVTLALPHGALHDITLSCDVTATVADTARVLIRAGVCADRALEDIAANRSAPLTLRVRPDVRSAPVLLDPASVVATSGLQSAWIIEPIGEFGVHSEGQRMIEVAGHAQVLSGPQSGVRFSLIAGANVIGRDSGCRIVLNDNSVSRRHAVIEVGEGMRVRDLGSANGLIVDGQGVTMHEVRGACTVMLGEVSLRVTLGSPVRPPRGLSHRLLHTRSPRVDPRFPSSERELPAPPVGATPNRVPVLAMLAPMMMGGAMYAVTQSPMSLLMVAFSPFMMIGSWVDGKLGGRRKLRRDLAGFAESLAAERVELQSLRTHEIQVRGQEVPSLRDIAAAINGRGTLLWARRPEHRSFLEVRFGEGALPSRTALSLPDRGRAALHQWAALREVEREFLSVGPVPVRERFDRCGSIGVTGNRHWADGMARSLVLQLVGLHSPTEILLACFAGSTQAEEWSWLKWLPHVNAVTSPISAGQLADDADSASRLILALEGLLLQRIAGRGARGKVRSHLNAHTRNDLAHGEAVSELPTTPAAVVLVLEGSVEEGLIDRSRLIALAEDGPDLGIHLIWVSREQAGLPAACRTFIQCGPSASEVNFVRTGSTVPLQHLEYIDEALARDLARTLSPVEDAGERVLDESDLPKSLNLSDVHHVDLSGTAAPILRAWAASGSLKGHWRTGVERDPIALAAIVGQGPEGAVTIDLRAQGPHALVGGTTGAGKSEFLQTWIMSLAAQLSPDRLTFLLVDYKGGAAFAECADLPHTVGMVTDLSAHLVRRALISLRAELRYREELLAQHSAKDLITMERRSDVAAPPALIIVIDEFAALASDVPEFVDGVIDIAQRGRSLGLHLIMATQRPAGVIKDNLRTNTNLRVALRMADEADSADVLGVKDAAYFDAETPGRGAIKIGPGKISHFQTGYLGGWGGNARCDSQIEVRSLAFTEGEPWRIPPEPRAAHRARATPPRDIEQLRDAISEAARLERLVAPRRPWLAALPELLDLSDLRSLAAAEANEGRGHGLGEPRAKDAALIGLSDEPHDQAQRPVFLNLEEAGNAAFIGASGTGKTCALVTLAASLSQASATQPVQLYAIDGGSGGTLRVIAELPTVGAVAGLNDTELVGRILRKVLGLITERGPKYAAARAGSLSEYRRTPGGGGEARVVLMIDGFAAFRQATESLAGSTSPFQALSEIMSTGRAVGVHVVLTADRPTAIPLAMSSSLQMQYVLRLASPHDYAHLGVAEEVLASASAGRAVLAGEADEIQLALLAGSLEYAGLARAIEALAAELGELGMPRAPEVRNAPERVPLGELPTEVSGRPVYGIDAQTFAPVCMPTSGLGVIAGPAGSGLSTAALVCAAAFTRWAEGTGARVEKVLLTFTEDGLRVAGVWGRVAFGELEVCAVAREIVAKLLGKDSTSIGMRGVIVVERPADAEGTAAMPELIALAKVARRANVLVLFEFEQGAGAVAWDLFSALKQPRWGLVLQPDSHESQSPFRETVGRVARAEFPPGRGFTIEGGRVVPVQVAMP